MSKRGQVPGLRAAIGAFVLVLFIGLGAPSASALWQQQTRATASIRIAEALTVRCQQMGDWAGDWSQYVVVLSLLGKDAEGSSYEALSASGEPLSKSVYPWPGRLEFRPLTSINPAVGDAVEASDPPKDIVNFTIRINAEAGTWKQELDVKLHTSKKHRWLACGWAAEPT